MNNKLLVVGTMAYDSIESPFGKTGKILGGCATYIGLAASQFKTSCSLVSVVGDDLSAREAQQFFRKHAGEIRGVVSKYVVLKYSPKLQFVRDLGIERGNRVMEILDTLDDQSEDGK